MRNGQIEPADKHERKQGGLHVLLPLPEQRRGLLARAFARQSFSVMVSAVLACLILSVITDTFATPQNLFNVTRNFAFVAIIALGMTAVIITGGIDLSVGSTLGTKLVNQKAANLTGVPVRRVKISVYMFSALTAGIAGVLEAGWLGGATTNLGQSMELSVIAARWAPC